MSQPDSNREPLGDVGLVVIGRNEGQRLRACLEAVTAHVERCIYVDSGSTDGSPALARSLGMTVLELDESLPYTAARSRNAGFRKLLELHPDIECVQFVDGDCELDEGWLAAAVQTLQGDAGIAAICGSLLERRPEASIYNRLCGIEWQGPTGEIDACGGIAMYRAAAIRETEGFREDLIAGEEPELCLRLRRRGWRVLRIAAPMARHDAAILHFSQWWRRCLRSGHTSAEGFWLHGSGPERYRRRETLRNLGWGLALPLAAIGGAWATHGLSLLLLLGYGALYVRIREAMRRDGFSSADAGLYSAFCVLGKFPEALGQCRFVLNLLRGRRSRIIEYKRPARASQIRRR